jgi:hypothetical protein
MTTSASPSSQSAAGAIGTLQPYSAALPVGAAIRDVFRCGASYERAARNGEPAALLDLHDRNRIVTGAALRSDLPNLPTTDMTIRVEGILIPTTGGPNAVWVRSFESVDVLDENTCAFDKVLPGWIVDPAVVGRAVEVWWQLSPAFRVLVNAVFRRASVLERFLLVPASLDHHHRDDGGTLLHSVHVAEWGLELAAENPRLAKDILVTSLLLHDCGKVFEYRRGSGGNWVMSEVGRGVGHKMTTLMLVGPALGLSPRLTPSDRRQILHVLAASYAPSYAGFRRPRTAEASILAAVDRLSAETGRRR